jgi:phage tail sheath gpL-like
MTQGVPFSIPLTGLASSNPLPGIYIEIDFAQGQASGPNIVYGALLIGNKLSSGTATVETVVYGPYGNSQVQLATENDAITLFGQGSELHRMWRRFVKKNATTPVSAICVAESAGAQATMAIQFATVAAAAGNIRLYMGDEFVDTALSLGDTPDAQATNVAASVATKPNWAATATAGTEALPGGGTVHTTSSSASLTFSASQTLPAGTELIFGSQGGTKYYLASAVSGTSGTLTAVYTGSGSSTDTATVQGILTLTARQKGPRGNWLRASAVVQGTGVNSTSSVTAQSFFTGGTTADSNANALATIAATRFYYLVSAAEDSTQLGALSSQVSSQALPVSGIRQTIFASSIDTEGNAQTIAIALNQARAEIFWMQNADRTPSEIASDVGALCSLGEQPDGLGAPSLHNFDGLGIGSRVGGIDTLWDMPSARSGTVPTNTTLSGALNNGLSPIATNALGQTYLVMRATTRSLTNGANDYRIRDPHKVRICDFYGDALAAMINSLYSGKDIIDNPVTGQVFRSNNLVWPLMLESSIDKLTQDWGDDGQFQAVPLMIANTVVIREQSPRSRMSARIPASPVDILHQVAVQILQVA